jgi:hypothetical protein
MIPIKKNLFLTALVGMLILLVIPTVVFPRIWGNGAGGGYDGADGGSSNVAGIQSQFNTIETYVIRGAGFYLDAYSDILVLLNRIEESELSGMDYDEVRHISDRALMNMYNAIETYYYLIRRAEMTPYNEAVIMKLMAFDYAGFMEKRQLNSVLFNKVEEYLRKGDITGTFKYIYIELTAIVKMLHSIRNELYFGKIPELSNLWRLNELCSQTLLFGQYMSRVFYAIL